VILRIVYGRESMNLRIVYSGELGDTENRFLIFKKYFSSAFSRRSFGKLSKKKKIKILRHKRQRGVKTLRHHL
jgi:hypothetical protein